MRSDQLRRVVCEVEDAGLEEIWAMPRYMIPQRCDAGGGTGALALIPDLRRE
jgi:hypothetical protein